MPIKMYMVNQGKLDPIEKPVFSTGDAYIVVDKEAKKVYIWLGSKCSVDEKGTGAVEARRIDEEEFTGAAKIITYDEGMEDPEFLAKLEGLRIVSQNLAKSMLKDVKSGEFAGQAEFKNVLYRVSSEEFEGINAMKFIEVPFKKESLDPEDCFIGDLGTDIYVWQGSKSNIREKVKALQFAREFDKTRAGGQTPKIFEQGDDAEFMAAVFEGKKPEQDRKTVDFKTEVFDEVKKEEAAPQLYKEEPKPAAPAPAPKKEEPKPAAPAPKPAAPAPAPKKEEPKPAAPAPAPKAAAPAAPGGSQQILICKGGRLACPKCGNVSHYMMKEVEDRSRLVMDYPPIYGKKWVCGKCGSHFRKEE